MVQYKKLITKDVMNEPLVACLPANVLLTPTQVQECLQSDKVALRIQQKNVFPCSGDRVGVRLNLNVMKNTGQAIQTIHRGSGDGYKNNNGFYNGEAIGYAQAVSLKNAYFNVHQHGREQIALGQSFKHAMASVDGDFVSTEVDEKFVGTEIKFNPKNHHLFVDSNNHAVHFAEEVVVLGHRVYAKGVVYYRQDNAPKKKGSAPTQTLFRPAPTLSTNLLRARLQEQSPSSKSLVL